MQRACKFQLWFWEAIFIDFFGIMLNVVNYWVFNPQKVFADLGKVNPFSLSATINTVVVKAKLTLSAV